MQKKVYRSYSCTPQYHTYGSMYGVGCSLGTSEDKPEPIMGSPKISIDTDAMRVILREQEQGDTNGQQDPQEDD